MMFYRNPTTYFFLLFLLSHRVSSELCDVSTGESAIILDIAESEGLQTDQTTIPLNLAIDGVLEEGLIELSLSQEDQDYFSLERGRLLLIRPLDRDDQDLFTIRFQVLCSVTGGTTVKSIPVVVRVTDINDNAPVFHGAPYTVTVMEDSAIGTTIFRGIKASDADSGLNQQLEYRVIPGGSDVARHQEGFGFFTIEFPHKGFVTVKSNLDFEKTHLYYVTIEAVDHAADGLTKMSTTKLAVKLLDADDQDPKFILDSCNDPQSPSSSSPSTCPVEGQSPVYRTSVISGRIEGVLSVSPDRILAHDQDTLTANIRYSFLNGWPLSYIQHFTIDSRTAVVTQVVAVDASVSKSFNITIKAEEVSVRNGFSIATLLIGVRRVDRSPPHIIPSSYSGRVDEASPIDTPVTHDTSSDQLVLVVTDPDLDVTASPPSYTWELTSSAFRVTSEGHLVVAEKGLDRDPPSLGVHTFQVIAREAVEGGAASSPVTLSVELNDVNDNYPIFPIYPPITVTAGSQKRMIIKVKATDKDVGVYGEVTYKILSLDPSSKGLFQIDTNSGVLELVGEVKAGQLFSVTVSGRDGLGLEGLTVIDVHVAKAPNTGGPSFRKSSYTVVVPEDAEHGRKIVTLNAIDPEGDTPRYSLVEGNHLRHFDIDGLSGTMIVIAPIDREKVKSYKLKIQAEDDDGQFGYVIVSIIVADVNDVIPEFNHLPYSFRVDEGKSNSEIGAISATDLDTGDAGKVIYSLIKDVPFRIDPISGQLSTTYSLDYEKQQVHYLEVLASDKGKPANKATATVTILVNDITDEDPLFKETFYKSKVKENAPLGTIVTTVKAVDPDSSPSITYVIKSGPTDLFAVDPTSGRVTTVAELDYEAAVNHSLIIGTIEAENQAPQATCTVLILIEDINDHTPVMESIHPSHVHSAVPPGTLITTVLAKDKDGSSPNNKITYELGGHEDDHKYFTVDPTDGSVRVKNTLKDTPKPDVVLKVIAHDGGDPRLLSSVDVKIIIIPTPSSGGAIDGEPPAPIVVQIPASFILHDVVVKVAEDVIEGHVITKLLVSNKPKDYYTNLQCSILESHLHDMFEAVINHDGDCEVKIGPQRLDYETKIQHNITVALHSLATPLPTPETEARIVINILDVNDNSPIFKHIDGPPLVMGSKDHPIVYTIVQNDVEVGQRVLQITAEDLDSGPGGDLRYNLVPGTNRGAYFSVDGATGVVVTAKPLTEVPSQLLPFNLTLLAMDNPNHPSVHHTTSASVIINIVDDSTQIVLAVDAPISQVKQELSMFREVLGHHSKHMVLIENVESHKYISTNGIQTDPTSTDIWFNVIDPLTSKLFQRDNPAVLPLILDGPDKNSLLHKLSQSLDGINALEIRQPELQLPKLKEDDEIELSSSSHPIRIANTIEGSQLALFTLGAAIILLGTIAIAVLCISWLRFTKRRNAAEKTLMVIAPSIDRCDSVLDSSTKEYEVQVLHMSVPMDDESVHEVLPPHPRHHISLDNVSYISKQHLTNDLSSSDDGHSPGSSSPSMAALQDTNNGWATSKSFTTPSAMAGRNPAYERFTDHLHREDEDDDGPLSISTTNENVLFGRRHPNDTSPVEDTTEL